MHSSNPRRSYSDFNIWPYDLEHVLHVALGSGIIFTKFDLRQRIRAWIISFLMLIRYVTLWLWHLTRWPWKLCGTWSVTWSKCTKFERNRAIPGWSIDNFAIFLRCDLDRWPLDLELLQQSECHAFKLRTKFEPYRIIHCWVIDDLARFRRAILDGGARLTRRLSGMRGPNFTKLGRGIGRSFLHKKFVSEFRHCLAFSNAGGSKISDVENDAKFRIFWPPSILVIKALPITEPPEYIWWPSTAWLLSAVDW